MPLQNRFVWSGGIGSMYIQSMSKINWIKYACTCLIHGHMSYVCLYVFTEGVNILIRIIKVWQWRCTLLGMTENIFMILSVINHRSLLPLSCLCMSVSRHKLSKMTTKAEEKQRQGVTRKQLMKRGPKIIFHLTCISISITEENRMLVT